MASERDPEYWTEDVADGGFGRRLSCACPAAETLADEGCFFWWRQVIQLGSTALDPTELMRRLAPCSAGFRAWFKDHFDELPVEFIRGPNWEDRHRRTDPEA